MTDGEKFNFYKQQLIDENEQKFGKEIRSQYGDEAVERSYLKIKSMVKKKHAEIEVLKTDLDQTLLAAFQQGNPSGDLAQKAAELHRRWLSFYWDTYSKEAHLGVTQMYVEDPRFTAYYDKIAPECADFLLKAVRIYCA